MAKFLLFPAVFAIILFVSSSSSNNQLEQHKAVLLDRLLGPNSSYNKTILPPSSECDDEEGNNTKCPFVVQLRLFLVRVHEVIENAETLVTTTRFQIGWTDSTLRWNPDDYGGVDEIISTAESVWIPDLHVANTVEDMYSLTKNDVGVRITHEGQVWYHPTGRLSTRCALQLDLFPYDHQRCSIVVESLMYTSKELTTVPRRNKTNPVSLGMYSENPMWGLVGATGFPALYKTGTNTGFSRIHFWIMLRRKPDYYERAFLAPLFLLSILQVLTYLIPMHNIDRVSQATVVMLTAFFLQGYIGDSLPKTSENSPVQIYINLIIGLSVATVLVCVITSVLVDPDEGLQLWGLMPLGKKCYKSKSKASVQRKSISEFIDAGSSVKDVPIAGVKKIKTATLIAAIINWIGFFSCIAVSALYPILAFVGTKGLAPPMPQPPENGTTNSYYAEF